MVVKITNTLMNPLVLCYRIPSAKGERANPVLEVSLPPRALLQDVAFPSQEYFNVFESQNKQYIEDGTIIIGATNAKKAEKMHEDNNKIEKAKVEEKIHKNTNQLENSATSVKARMNVNVKKDSG